MSEQVVYHVVADMCGCGCGERYACLFTSTSEQEAEQWAEEYNRESGCDPYTMAIVYDDCYGDIDCSLDDD